MLSKFKDRRRNRRYGVCWEARLLVRFSEGGGEMAAIVANISLTGALAQSPRMDIKGRHLTVARPLPRLHLSMETPEGEVTSDVEVRWYRWSVSGDHFEVGLLFTRMPAESQARIDRLVNGLKRSGVPPC